MSTNITPIRELQSQLESIGMLISSVSHNIKGLLTGLDGGMYLVNTGLQKNNQQRIGQGWEMVQRNIERIRGPVMKILYYATKREPPWQAPGSTRRSPRTPSRSGSRDSPITSSSRSQTTGSGWTAGHERRRSPYSSPRRGRKGPASGCSSPTGSHRRTTVGSGSNPSLKRGPVLL